MHQEVTFPRARPIGSEGPVGLRPLNDFQNNGAKS